MTLLSDLLTWPDWAGIQGITSVIALVSVGAVLIDYLRQRFELTLVGVDFSVEPTDLSLARPNRPLVTMSPRRGVVLYDVEFVTWLPGVTAAAGTQPESVAQWDTHSDEITIGPSLRDHDDQLVDVAQVRVGLIGLRRTPFGFREVSYRIGVLDGARVERWEPWRLWQWPWRPRRRRGHWVKFRYALHDLTKRGPWANVNGEVR